MTFLSRSSVAAATAGILLAHFGSLRVPLRVPLAHAAWGWSPSPMPSPMPMPSPPPSPPAVVCGTWGAWGACSVTCGSGSRERSRGGSCSPYRESEACDQGACVAPCGEWAQWAACPVTCGGGTRSRSRSGGCSSSTESEACNSEVCPVPCGAWGQWSSCTATCGGGTRSRSRGECSGTSSESEACNSNACVAAATAAPTSPPGSSTACGAWQPWSQCTASCGPATRMRSRGGECQPFLESEACSQAACVAPSPPQNPVASPSPTTTATTMATTVATTASTAVTGRPLTSNVVEVRMRIASDFSNAARDIDTFRESFRQGMADAAGISKDRIIVNSITRGSIIVDFLVRGAEQMGEISAAQAVQELEIRLEDQTYSWPAVLRPMMAEGASVQAKKTTTMNQAELDAMVVLSSGSNTVFLTPEAGFAAPPGCSCVAGDGITAGCAKHKGISPAWCLVASGCRESMEGVLGPWAFCVESANSDASPDPNKIIIASGNGSAVNIASMWLLVAVFVQGLLGNPFVP